MVSENLTLHEQESVGEPGHSLVLWLHTGRSALAGWFFICSSLKVSLWRYFCVIDLAPLVASTFP